MKKLILLLLFLVTGLTLIGCGDEKKPSLSFSEEDLTVFAYEKFTLNPTITNDKDGLEVVYSIGDSSILQITEDGFSGKKSGSTMIIASIKGVPGTTKYIFVQVIAPNQFKIQYVLNGGGISINSPIAYSEGQLPLELPRPVKAGFVFMGWFETSDLTGPSYFSISANQAGNKVYYAKWD